MEYHISPVVRCTVLEQIDSLPCAQRHPPFVYGDRQVCLRERRADVRRHVVRPLHGMPVEPLILGRQAREEVVASPR